MSVQGFIEKVQNDPKLLTKLMAARGRDDKVQEVQCQSLRYYDSLQALCQILSTRRRNALSVLSWSAIRRLAQLTAEYFTPNGLAIWPLLMALL